jgi:integrase
MKKKRTRQLPANPEKDWQKTQYSNLIRYVPSGTYYARLRVKGKLIRRSLKTDVLTVAKLRLSDFEKHERQRSESSDGVARGRITVADAIEIFRQRKAGDASLKPRTRQYHEERIKSLLKSWRGLAEKEIRALTKTDCLDWAAKFGKDSSASVFNHTIGILGGILEIGVEVGARYDNPAKFIKRATERPKVLALPEPDEFRRFVSAMETGGSRDSKNCADLVRFLAYGGFRKNEASNITWADCDFEKNEITVRGDPETGTKNWTIRRVPMIPDMVELLQRLRQNRSGEPVSQPVMSVRECQKAVDRAANKIGMARITHHDLRHLFATLCIESDVDIPTVSRWLGHKDGGALAMKVYGHLRDQHSVAMAQKVSFNKQSTSETKGKRHDEFELQQA